MRKNIVAANWKMNKTLTETNDFINRIIRWDGAEHLSEKKNVIIAAPFIYLHELAKIITDIPNLYIAAQNCHHEEKGAYTGEISAQQIQSIGVTHVIVGHSERRQYFGETDKEVLQKIQHALACNLIPIFCCGEPLSQRESDSYKEFIQGQLENSVFQLSAEDFSKIIIAYEPIWAIGTGKTASAEQAQEVHEFIRSSISAKFGTDIAAEIPILYGGSCNSQNALSLFSQTDVDGGLIGGASLKLEEFEQIILSI